MKIELDNGGKRLDVFDDRIILTIRDEPDVMVVIANEELDELIEVLLGIRDKRTVQQQTEADTLPIRKWNMEIQQLLKTSRINL